MIRSLYAGVSGLKNHQTRMDVIGNNVANVNTYGFKASRVAFADIFSQTIGTASAPRDDMGGTNIKQVGLGSKVAAINTNWNPGSFQATETETNVALDGDGFFMVRGSDGATTYYTRVGNFELDGEGNLVLSGLGYMVLSSDEDIINAKGYTSVAIDKNGVITGLNADGAKKEIATLGVVNFYNPSGLKKIGNSLFQDDVNSGSRIEDDDLTAGNNGTGEIQSGGLEMSNVSLADEFTDMITTQRGYQANSRVITVSDTLLEELINLKR